MDRVSVGEPKSMGDPSQGCEWMVVGGGRLSCCRSAAGINEMSFHLLAWEKRIGVQKAFRVARQSTHVCALGF